MAIEDFNDQKGEPDYTVFQIPKAALEILQLVQLHFQSCILAHMVPSPALHREIIIDKNDMFAAVEIACCELVERVIESCVKNLGIILGRQRRSDFSAKGEGSSVTKTSEDACKFIKNMIVEVGLYLNGENLASVLHEVGSTFHKYVFLSPYVAIALCFCIINGLRSHQRARSYSSKSSHDTKIYLAASIPRI
jgi:hypothetical protein